MARESEIGLVASDALDRRKSGILLGIIDAAVSEGYCNLEL